MSDGGNPFLDTPELEKGMRVAVECHGQVMVGTITDIEERTDGSVQLRLA